MYTEPYYENSDFSSTKADFEELNKVKFVKCSFRSADFSDVFIHHCYFDTCDFTGCRLNSAMIKSSAFVNCSFRYANFFGTTLDDCKMTGSAFPSTSFTAFTILAGNWSYTVLIKFQRHRASVILGQDFTMPRKRILISAI